MPIRGDGTRARELQDSRAIELLGQNEDRLKGPQIRYLKGHKKRPQILNVWPS